MYSIHDEGQHEAAGKNPLGWQLLAHAQGELAHQLQHLLLLRPVHQLTTPQHTPAHPSTQRGSAWVRGVA
jgi:hypothetical protein